MIAETLTAHRLVIQTIRRKLRNMNLLIDVWQKLAEKSDGH